MSDTRLSSGTLAATLLATVFLFESWLHSSFVSDAAGALSLRHGDYGTIREERGVGGFPMREVQKALNARLPVETPVGFDPEMRRMDPLHQQLTAQLYPRKRDDHAPHVLSFGAGDRLATWRGRNIVLQSPPGANPGAADAVRPEPLTLSWWRFAVCVLALLGWGSAAAALLGRVLGSAGDGPRGGVGTAVVAASVLMAIFASAATWVQLRLHFAAVTVGGLVAGAAAVGWRLWRAPAQSLWRDVRAAVRGLAAGWEGWILLGSALLFLLELAYQPVTVWDGPGVWLFHTKQLFSAGYFPKADLLRPEYRFSHGEYPLLFPAWLAQFTSLERAYNDRMAALGIPVLLFGLLAAVWRTGRQALGRWPGMVFTLGLLLVLARAVTEGYAAAGYADPYVALFIVILVLALVVDDQPLAWLAAAGASLTKREGFVYAAAVALVYLAGHPKARALPLRRRALRLLAFLPAAIHVLWAAAAGAKDAYADAALGASHTWLGRLSIIFGSIPALADERPVLWDGCVGLILIVVLLLSRRHAREGTALGLLALGFVGFAVLVMLTTPYPLRWHISTGLGRILVYPAILAVLAPLLVLEQSRTTITDTPSDRSRA